MNTRHEWNRPAGAFPGAIACAFACLFTGEVRADEYSDKIMDLNPLAYWRLGESSGATAVDAAGGYNGTYRRGVDLGLPGVVDENTAASFDGWNDHVEIPHDDAFLIDEGSVQLWFYAEDLGGNQGLFSKDSTNYDTGGHLTVYLDSSRLKVRLQSTSRSYTLQARDIAEQTWYHVLFVFGPDGMKLYLNGDLASDDDYDGGLGTSSGGAGNYEPIALGANSWGSRDRRIAPLRYEFEGRLDEVAVFDTALQPAQVQALADPGWLFTDVSSDTGFDVQSTTDYHGGSGLHWGDLDDDGDLDAIITGNSTSRLLINNNLGESFFVSNFGGGGRDRQGALLDIDNDGDLDFWHIDERLYENNGAASFTDRGNLGFNEPSNNEAVAAVDVNRDGWCDIVMFSENGNWIGHHQGAVPVILEGTDDRDYGLNDWGDAGNGDFCSAGDVNNDGCLDFFYHFFFGRLFSSNGNGTYSQSNGGILVVTGNSDKIGSAWGDYDNDGDLDLFVPRYDDNRDGYLWRNGGSTFSDVASAAGLDNDDRQRSACWGDYDNDGDLDLYLTTTEGGNVLYRNEGDGTFTAVNEGADAAGNGHDAVFVDYDNDGDLDLAVTREDSTNILLRNNTDNRDYLKVRLIGFGEGGTNRAAIGVRVELYTAGGATLLARRDVGVARGYGGTEPLWLHFGGVDNSETYMVRVHFLTGTRSVAVVPGEVETTIGATTVPQMLTIEEQGGSERRLIRWVEVDPGSS
ncbi:MAG: FG-GAP-like repeat-containing protein [Planctomycetota bacterium]|nr:FG-GAP-like repeat-containing protein [Planctomycetota bacterium]